MEKLPISLCMIVRDEAEELEQCLAKAWPLVRQVIILDTGSKDNTSELAEDLGASVYHFDWNGDFSAARNESISYALQPWILVLDADERIVSSKMQHLNSIVTNPAIAGAEVTINNLNDRGLDQHFRVVRLFRNNSAIEFEGKIHEGVIKSLLSYCEKKGKQIVDSHIRISHHGYLSRNLKVKGERNLSIIRQQLRDDPDDLFLLLKEYEELGKLGRQDDCDVKIQSTFRTLLSTTKEKIRELPFAPVIIANFAEYCVSHSKLQEGLTATEWGLKIFINEPWLIYFHSLVLFKLGNLELAKSGFQTCLKLEIKPALYYVEPGIASWMSLNYLAEIELALNNPTKAMAYLEKSLMSNPGHHRTKELQIDVYLKKGDLPAGVKTCIDMLSINPEDLWALVNGARILAVLGMKERSTSWLNKALQIQPGLKEAVNLLDQINKSSS